MEKEKTEILPFYHIGRVIKCLTKINSDSADKKYKAVVEMWDNNIITCETGGLKVEDGDFVVVLFDGVVQGNNVIMHPSKITDKISKQTGEELWENFKKFFDKAKPPHPMTG
ncbi:hypothetical protein M1293_00855 [Candidatus Parvarchaeota archaeon]|nr:hypothetical protein [Candidatus Parvarchaeota archaeon]